MERSKYSLPYENLDLYHTLISGQTFEWSHDYENDVWNGSIYGQPIILKQVGTSKRGFLKYEAESDLSSDIQKYFHLDENYPALITKINFGEENQEILDKLYGLRVIRQDPWLCINSFIISQNNTVANIRNSLRKITALIQGEEPDEHYIFPTYDQLRNLTTEELKSCKVGYRSEYLQDFYNKISINPNLVQDLEQLDYVQAKEELMKIKGVGEKVADCILLYAYGKYEAYPIDTHLRQATHEIFFADSTRKPSDREVRKWATQKWGDLAGLSHFFLFTYHRLYGSVSNNEPSIKKVK